jgi:hypothetical protein
MEPQCGQTAPSGQRVFLRKNRAVGGNIDLKSLRTKCCGLQDAPNAERLKSSLASLLNKACHEPPAVHSRNQQKEQKRMEVEPT